MSRSVQSSSYTRVLYSRSSRLSGRRPKMSSNARSIMRSTLAVLWYCAVVAAAPGGGQASRGQEREQSGRRPDDGDG